jgi:hypothetical protein
MEHDDGHCRASYLNTVALGVLQVLKNVHTMLELCIQYSYCTKL